MDIWGGEKIVFPRPVICSACRRNMARTGWHFEGEQVLVSICGYCEPGWPLHKIVAKMNNKVLRTPKQSLMSARDFQYLGQTPPRG